MQIGQDIENLLAIELDRFSFIVGWFLGRSCGRSDGRSGQRPGVWWNAKFKMVRGIVPKDSPNGIGCKNSQS